VLITAQDLEQQPTASQVSETVAVESPESSPEPVITPPRRGLPNFFSFVGKKEEAEPKDVDVARARIARVTRAKIADDKKGAVARAESAKETTSETASSKPASSSKPAPRPGGFKMRYFAGMFIYLIAAQFIGLLERNVLTSFNADVHLFNFFGIAISTSTVLFLVTLIVILVVLAKFDLLPTSLVGKPAQKQPQKGASSSAAPKAPQPTVRQGVKGSNDALYQQYRQTQRKKK
jgi:hypothetical protein